MCSRKHTPHTFCKRICRSIYVGNNTQYVFLNGQQSSFRLGLKNHPTLIAVAVWNYTLPLASQNYFGL